MKTQFRNVIGVFIWLILITVSILWYNKVHYEQDKLAKESKLATTKFQNAYFAGWCFWCVESGFEKYKDQWILEVVSGYAGWNIKSPTYEQVGAWWTGHREAVKVQYDPTQISYEDLLQIFWRLVDPTDDTGQYVDKWFEYTTAIWYQTDEEKRIAEVSRKSLAASWRYSDEIITPVIEYVNFYDAEEYHQDFYIKSPIRYNTYTSGSWRKGYLERTWWENLDYQVLSQ